MSANESSKLAPLIAYAIVTAVSRSGCTTGPVWKNPEVGSKNRRPRITGVP